MFSDQNRNFNKSLLLRILCIYFTLLFSSGSLEAGISKNLKLKCLGVKLDFLTESEKFVLPQKCIAITYLVTSAHSQASTASCTLPWQQHTRKKISRMREWGDWGLTYSQGNSLPININILSTGSVRKHKKKETLITPVHSKAQLHSCQDSSPSLCYHLRDAASSTWGICSQDREDSLCCSFLLTFFLHSGVGLLQVAFPSEVELCYLLFSWPRCCSCCLPQFSPHLLVLHLFLHSVILFQWFLPFPKYIFPEVSPAVWAQLCLAVGPLETSGGPDGGQHLPDRQTLASSQRAVLWPCH